MKQINDNNINSVCGVDRQHAVDLVLRTVVYNKPYVTIYDDVISPNGDFIWRIKYPNKGIEVVYDYYATQYTLVERIEDMKTTEVWYADATHCYECNSKFEVDSDTIIDSFTQYIDMQCPNGCRCATASKYEFGDFDNPIEIEV